MAFDACVVKCFVHESQSKLIGARIDKIHQPQKDELYLHLRNSSGNTKLYISANPSYPRIYFSQEKIENPDEPPMFCMLLRKHIGSGKIKNVYQLDFERILVFEIECRNELMDITTKKLIVEIMGKHSNIILLDENGVIIDSIKRIDISTSSVRQILPALKYKIPPKQEKLNPLLIDYNSLPEYVPDPESYVMSNFYGISKLTAREISYICEKLPFNQAMKFVFEKINSNLFSPCVIYSPDGTPLDFSAIEITQYEDKFKKYTSDTISDVAEKYYSEKALFLRLSQFSSVLTKLISNNIERCKKKLSIFNQQLLDSAKRDKYKEFGELITSNLYRIKHGDTSVTVENYFKQDMPLVEIKLDETISPAKNAQRYFTKYNKAKNAEQQANIQIKSANSELIYLESVLDELQRARTYAEISEIKEELIQEGYISSPSTTKKKKASVTSPEKIEFDGYTIYVGKNNKQNDYLTFKVAKSNDLWFHAKNIPGSHVIVVNQDNQTIPDNVILKAATLAAIHSKVKGGTKTPVDCTNVKNVKKQSGAKPGMVIYDHYNTFYVTPET
ncbi:MAG: NFACT family protein [Clostridia bacterium]|nr:NFACT family protein [Clostridia bacterium]